MNFGDLLNKIKSFFQPQTTILYKDGRQETGPAQTPIPTYPPGTISNGNDYSNLPIGQGYMPRRLDEVKGAATANPGFDLSVPGPDGQPFQIPHNIAQVIGNVFEPDKLATEAASVLVHPNQQTRTLDELKRLAESWNVGENAGMRIAGDNLNKNGSTDRGLFQVNSNTFNGMSQDPNWRSAMDAAGIGGYGDMNNLDKNVAMAKLILARRNYDRNAPDHIAPNPSWDPWYAAPLNLRSR